ncbi:Allantoate permease [Sporothrix eucalyptigena]
MFALSVTKRNLSAPIVSDLACSVTSHTSLTLAGSDNGDDPIAKFWAHNVPQIGLSYHFVLHLAFAVAAYHLSHLQEDDVKRQYYASLAEQHVSAGLAEFSKALPSLNDSNCGALYVAATLVCYYTFAAGPTCPGDFLVCRDNDEKMQWVSLIHGVRLIRTTIDPDVLYSGLMAPLGPAGEPAPQRAPMCARQNFPRIDWEGPLSGLHKYMAASKKPDVEVFLSCFDALSPSPLNDVGRLIGYYITQTLPSVGSTVLSLISSNIAGYTKKTTVAAIYMVGYAAGNIVGPQMLRPRDAPRYVSAEITILVCFVLCIVDLLFINWWCRRENRCKAAIRARLCTGGKSRGA